MVQGQPVAEFPTSGSGVATKAIGLKAYLDPLKSSTRPSKSARYVFVDNPKLFFDDVGTNGKIGNNAKIWWKMPPGRYVVYPIGAEDITFSWWHN